MEATILKMRILVFVEYVHQLVFVSVCNFCGSAGKIILWEPILHGKCGNTKIPAINSKVIDKIRLITEAYPNEDHDHEHG